jgi:hypothetical protein
MTLKNQIYEYEIQKKYMNTLNQDNNQKNEEIEKLKLETEIIKKNLCNKESLESREIYENLYKNLQKTADELENYKVKLNEIKNRNNELERINIDWQNKYESLINLRSKDSEKVL